ncbi:MAG: MerR family transcriptional regulator [Acidobacteriota bacterium]|nr:MerR family transcriptional regulator [Acidobacteriota bacterium]
MKRTAKGSGQTGYFNISDVARLLDISSSTLRMWEKVGLIAPERSDGKYRLFTPDDIKLLKRIKFLKSTKNLNVGGVLHVLKQEGAARAKTQAQAAVAAKPSSSADAIGRKLRELRLGQRMTLKDAARRAKLSVGFLSALERSQTNASIATLQKLAKLYNTNFLSFFDDSEPPSKLVRPAERKVLETQPGTVIELLALGQTMMETQLWRIAPGASSGGAYHHEGEEFIYVLQGRFEIWLEETEHYMLRRGDSLYFSSAQSHRWLNPGKVETELLWINTPPTF